MSDAYEEWRARRASDEPPAELAGTAMAAVRAAAAMPERAPRPPALAAAVMLAAIGIGVGRWLLPVAFLLAME